MAWNVGLLEEYEEPWTCENLEPRMAFPGEKEQGGSASVIHRFVRWLDSPLDGFQYTSQSCPTQDSSSTPTER